MKTYATAANARRAARKQLGTDAAEGTDFEVVVHGKKSFSWELGPKHDTIEPPKAEEAAPVAPPKAEEAPVAGEFTYCPSCGVHLSNGISEDNGDGYDVNGETHYHKAHQFACLACDHEFGPKVTHKERRKGAVREVWDICEANQDMRRKDVIQLCVDKGINYYTARTQYQAWRTAVKNSN